jgi:hypothetical protein
MDPGDAWVLRFVEPLADDRTAAVVVVSEGSVIKASWLHQ